MKNLNISQDPVPNLHRLQKDYIHGSLSVPVYGAGTINECYEIGLEFGALGYQCFILQCRPNGCPWNEYETGADAARALRIIRANADKYRVKPDNIAMAGLSILVHAVRLNTLEFSNHKGISWAGYAFSPFRKHVSVAKQVDTRYGQLKEE